MKKHGRPLYSIFTYGLDWLRSILLKNQKIKTSALLQRVEQYFSGLFSMPVSPFIEKEF